MILDALVFAAHPDDAEIAVGGTIAQLSYAGLKVGIIDLSQGELSSRGNVESRKEEAEKAANILKISIRENLGLEDGSLKPTKKNINAVITCIRKFKPKIIFGPYKNDRHPDHIGTSQIVKEAWFYSGVKKIETVEAGLKQESYRPQKLYYYMQTYEFKPTFVNDISEFFEIKMNSIKAYTSQFHNPDYKGPETFISQPGFIKHLEARARYFGFQIGKEFGEPFYSEELIQLDLINLLNEKE